MRAYSMILIKVKLLQLNYGNHIFIDFNIDFFPLQFNHFIFHLKLKNK